MKQRQARQHSISHIVSLLFATVFLLSFLAMLFTNLHALENLREKSAEGLQDTLSTYTEGLTSDIASIESYLLGKSVGASAENLRVLEYGNPTSTEYYRAVTLEQAELSSTLAARELLSGLFVFPEENREFLYAAWKRSSPVVEALEAMLLQGAEEDTLGELTRQGWFVYKAGDRYCLVRVVRVNKSYVGAWSEFSALLPFMDGESNLVEEALYRSPQGECYQADGGVSPLNPTLAGEGRHYGLFRKEGRLCLSISSPADCLKKGTMLVLVVPDRRLTSSLTQNYVVLLLSTLAILAAGVAAFFVLRAFVIRPLDTLRESIDGLRRGDFSTRVGGSSSLTEIAQVNNAFNEMVGQLQSLKIAVYEERLQRQNLEIQYLKTQLAPHFLINCLNLIFHLSRQGEGGKVQRMAIGLGTHLRYVLSSQRATPLEKETDMVRNYLDLSALRYPNCIAFYLDVDPQARQALVLPMFLVSLAENTVKHCVEPGRLIEFHVEAQVAPSPGEEGEPQLCVTFWDTGDGFTPQVLEDLNRPGAFSSEDGSHIGLQNTVLRLRLAYGDQCDIRFSNRPGAGAQISFHMPYRLQWAPGEGGPF